MKTALGAEWLLRSVTNLNATELAQVFTGERRAGWGPWLPRLAKLAKLTERFHPQRRQRRRHGGRRRGGWGQGRRGRRRRHWRHRLRHDGGAHARPATTARLRPPTG